MDARAFDRLGEVFIRQDPDAIKGKINIDQLSSFNNLWSAFISMLSLNRFQALREFAFHRLRHQISAIGLSKDQVIPARSILQTLSGGTKKRNRIPMSILDFPYPYSHENPFPTGNPVFRAQVNQAFHQVFSRAAKFLS
jgi:hypothetical protein